MLYTDFASHRSIFLLQLVVLDSLPLCTLSAWILISRTPVEASVEVNIPRITATVVSHLDPTSEVGGRDTWNADWITLCMSAVSHVSPPANLHI